jgi:hypothetical protein
MRTLLLVAALSGCDSSPFAPQVTFGFGHTCTKDDDCNGTRCLPLLAPNEAGSCPTDDAGAASAGETVCTEPCTQNMECTMYGGAICSPCIAANAASAASRVCVKP